MAKKFPYRASDDKALEKGEQVGRARYFQGLRESAKDIIRESKEYDEEIGDMIHQYADNAVIYTRDCLEILRFSDNWTAASDEGMELSGDVSQFLCQAAYFAYSQDLAEMVEAHLNE